VVHAAIVSARHKLLVEQEIVWMVWDDHRLGLALGFLSFGF
jgi:hypothetical protein